MNTINVNDVVAVYSGKDGCRCGCIGKYYYAKQHQAEGGKERGYPVSDDEVNDRMVAKVVARINQEIVDSNFINGVVIDGYIYDLPISDTRSYTAYLHEPVQAEQAAVAKPSRVMLVEEA